MQLFWTNDVLDKFVEQSNSYAKVVNNRKGWSPLTRNELCRFFALVLCSGISKFPVWRWYWDNNKKSKYHLLQNNNITHTQNNNNNIFL